MKAHFNAADSSTFNSVALETMNAALKNIDGDDPINVNEILKATNMNIIWSFFDPVYEETTGKVQIANNALSTAQHRSCFNIICSCTTSKNDCLSL